MYELLIFEEPLGVAERGIGNGFLSSLSLHLIRTAEDEYRGRGACAGQTLAKLILEKWALISVS